MEQRPILVVEDDDDLRETLAYNLRADGYETLLAADGVAALELARRQPVALVLLDVMLPRLDGLDVLRQLRARPETAAIPVLMLTARAEESDIVVGLELGADDYVAKPFAPTELVARVRSVLRRARPESHAAPVRIGDLLFDQAGHRVELAGRLIELSPAEFEILAALVEARGRVVTRDQLIDRLHPHGEGIVDRTIDVYVSRLRAKLGNERYVVTVRAAGYRLGA